MELAHKQRMETLDVKFTKIPLKSKGPSKAENWKIMAIHTLYEIAALGPRLKEIKMRTEIEQRVRRP